MQRKLFFLAALVVAVIGGMPQVADAARMHFQFSNIHEYEEVIIYIKDKPEGKLLGHATCEGTSECKSNDLKPGRYYVEYRLSGLGVPTDAHPRNTQWVTLGEDDVWPFEGYRLAETWGVEDADTTGGSRHRSSSDTSAPSDTSSAAVDQPAGDRDGDGVLDDNDVMPDLGVVCNSVVATVKVQRFDEQRGWYHTTESVTLAQCGVTSDGRPTLRLYWADAAEVASVDHELVHRRAEWESAIAAFGQALQAYNDLQWQVVAAEANRLQRTSERPLAEAAVWGTEDVIRYSRPSRAAAGQMVSPTRTIIEYSAMQSDANILGRRVRTNARLVGVATAFERSLDRNFVVRAGAQVNCPEGERGAHIEARPSRNRAIYRYVATAVVQQGGGECCPFPLHGDMIVGAYGMISTYTGQVGGMAFGDVWYDVGSIGIGAYVLVQQGWDFRVENHATRTQAGSAGLLVHVWDNDDNGDKVYEPTVGVDVFGGYLHRAANFTGDNEPWFNNRGGLIGAKVEFWTWFNVGVYLELTELRDSYHEDTYDDEKDEYAEIYEPALGVWIGVDLIGAGVKLFGEE